MAATKTTLRTQTLLRIAEHGDKLIRLSQLVSEMDSPFLLAATSFLDEESSLVDIVEAFEKDLSATAVMLKKIALIVEDVNSEHISPELLTKYSPEQCNLQVLFPNHYDAENQTLHLFGVRIKSKGFLSNADSADVKKSIYDQVVGELRTQYSYEEYKKQLSIMKKLQSAEKPKPEDSDYDIYSYAGLLVKAQKWGSFCEHILKAVNKEASFRAELSFEDRRLVDERIVGGRAMIDGVIKSSTYITKHEIVQAAPAHKKESKLNEIAAIVRDYPNILALEIDSGSSLEKMHKLLLKMQEMGLRVPDAFELKVRLLGNYGASGLHISGSGSVQSLAGYASAAMRIVAIDPKSPTSLAHELAHFCDHYTDPSEKSSRDALVKHFSEKMLFSTFNQQNPLPPKYIQYALRNREIFARLGEVGFTLLELGYRDGETFEQVMERDTAIVRDGKTGDIELDVAISQRLSDYASNNPAQAWMYFDLASWTPEELGLVKTLAVSLYQDHSPALKRELQYKIKHDLVAKTTAELAQRKAERTKRTRVKTESDKIFDLLKNINGHELSELVSVVLQEGLVFEGDVAYMFSRYGRGVGTGLSSTSLRSLHDQVSAMASVVPVLMAHNYTIDAHMMYEIALRFAARTTLFSPDRPSDEISQMLAKDLSRIYAATSLMGTQGMVMNAVFDRDENLYKNPLEMPFVHTWEINKKARLGADAARAELEQRLPNLMQARDLLIADSGMPGIVSIDTFDRYSGDLNEFAKNRLISNSLYQRFSTPEAMSESSFDWWHTAQKSETVRYLFSLTDEELLKTILATGPDLMNVFDVAGIECKLNGELERLTDFFLSEHAHALSSISVTKVAHWIKQVEAEYHEARYGDFKNNADKTTPYTMVKMDSAIEQLRHYFDYMKSCNKNRQTIRVRSEHVVKHELHGFSNVEIYPTSARVMSKLISDLLPALSDDWSSLLMTNQVLHSVLEKEIASRFPAGWSRGDVMLPIDLSASRGYLESSTDLSADAKIERLQRFAWQHPVNMACRALWVDEGRVSSFLLGSVNASLATRVMKKTDPVVQAYTDGKPVMLGAGESAQSVRLGAMLDALKLMKHSFEEMQCSIETVSMPAQCLSEVESIRHRLDDWVVKANALSPDVTRMVLESSALALREYGAALDFKFPSLPLHAAARDLSYVQRQVTLPLLMDGLFLKPLPLYIESAITRSISNQPVVSGLPEMNNDDWVLTPEITPAQKSETISFDDAPLLPADDVVMSTLSPETQEQIAYFMALNENVPSAGMGPLMPKKHQMRLF